MSPSLLMQRNGSSTKINLGTQLDGWRDICFRWWIGVVNMCLSQATSVFWPFGQPNHTHTSEMLIHVRSFHPLSCPPSLSHCTGCVIVSIAGGSCPPKHIEGRNSSRIQDSLPFTTHKTPPNHSLMDVIAACVFSSLWLHDGADPTFRTAVVRASGCINKRAKVRWTRWRWSALVFTLFLQLQGFSYWPVVVLLHPWSATLTPEVRPEALNTWFDLNKMKTHALSPKSVCGFSTLCLRWEELLTGRQLDGRRLSAVYLSASRRRWLLWDVSTHTTSGLLWRLFAWKYSNKCAVSTLFRTADHPGCTGLWIFLRGVRCGWSRWPAACPWSRQRTPACPASPVKTSRTPATDRLGYSSRSRSRTAALTSISLWK